ncbi:MAG TPA: type III secretion system export apparatus subunit SctS [Dokdonella sp.]|uniref:type III secretion system export apparatus subunit SctS n=1 Tax=Dokdonella sp. TaxID=2291710 RepID=UPI0025C5B83B|nr:type III secretion system export apparatus subunit SctS [Dokdonella sp.]MBX3691599.1 type III secretion system export apparatus subunit SctS [Dokdonella sp.]HNR90891.1 type III secretion system export apparatus subunit SctS [Dokdonella sp.]
MGFDIIRLTQDALWLVLVLSAPPIIAASIIGLLVAFLQAATQLQEQTFSYTVKFVVIVIVLFVTTSMIGGTLFHFSDRIFTDFPDMARH